MTSIYLAIAAIVLGAIATASVREPHLSAQVARAMGPESTLLQWLAAFTVGVASGMFAFGLAILAIATAIWS